MPTRCCAATERVKVLPAKLHCSAFPIGQRCLQTRCEIAAWKEARPFINVRLLGSVSLLFVAVSVCRYALNASIGPQIKTNNYLLCVLHINELKSLDAGLPYSVCYRLEWGRGNKSEEKVFLNLKLEQREKICKLIPEVTRAGQ